jgi:hypothetical protein
MEKKSTMLMEEIKISANKIKEKIESLRGYL